MCGGDIRIDAIRIVMVCGKNNVQKHIFRKIFRRHEKSSEAKCLEALILVVEVVGIEPATS